MRTKQIHKKTLLKGEQKNLQIFKIQNGRLMFIIKNVTHTVRTAKKSVFFLNIRTIPLLHMVRELRGKMSQLS